jgi:hypothetical protein
MRDALLMQRWQWVTERQFWVQLQGRQLIHGLPVSDHRFSSI